MKGKEFLREMFLEEVREKLVGKTVVSVDLDQSFENFMALRIATDDGSVIFIDKNISEEWVAN